MIYDKELIDTRIENVKDPIQKVLLQDVLKDVFRMLIDYSEEAFCKLEEKIDAELEIKEENYNIITGVCKREDIDETSSFLFKVKTEEEEVPGLLDTVFLACGYDKIKEFEGKTFLAEVETETDTYQIPVMLCNSYKYREKIEWLYHRFFENKIKWRTVNCPFLSKFMNVIDIEQRIPQGEKIKKIIVDIKDLNKYLHTDIVLLWNIQEFSMDTSPLTIPGEKVLLYEHRLEPEQENTVYFPILDEEEVFYTIKNEDSIIVRTEKRGYDSMDFIRIAEPDWEKDNTKLFLNIESNQRKLRHIDKHAAKKEKFLFTFGEIQRIVSSYTAYDGLYLESVSLKDSGENSQDCNFFIPLHNILDKRRVLLLSFNKAEGVSDILLHERMEFLVSEIQMMVEEYHCVGVFV